MSLPEGGGWVDCSRIREAKEIDQVNAVGKV